MILPKQMLPSFYEFVSKTYGVIVEVHEPPIERHDGTEFSRFMLWGRVFLVLSHSLSKTESTSVELVGGDRAGLEEIEKLWVLLVSSAQHDSNES